MELSQLKELVAINAYGTISAAAEQLHLTQPSLSRSMKRLEADLGQELFTRKRNSVTFNEAGLLALEHARDVLTAEQRMRDAFDDLARRQRTVRVGTVAPAPAWNLTARIVERFPGTILDPEIVSEREVERRLFDRTIDLGITLRPLALPNCHSIPLMVENLFLAAPIDSAYAQRASVKLSDIDHETFLVFEQIGFWNDILDNHIPHATIIKQKDREVFLQLIASSKLLCFTTDAPQNRGGITGRVAIPLDDADAHATFYLVALRDAPTSVLDIVKWIRESSD